MKKILFITLRVLTVVTLLSLSILPVFANGADERYSKGILVGLSSAPKSPLVGEKVGMLFYLQTAEKREYITTIPTADVIIESFLIQGRTPGEVLFEKHAINSAIGSFTLDYTFPEEGIYDIHVRFTTPDGEAHDVGFTKQIRQVSSSDDSWLPMISVGLGCFLGGFYLSAAIKRKYVTHSKLA